MFFGARGERHDACSAAGHVRDKLLAKLDRGAMGVYFELFGVVVLSERAHASTSSVVAERRNCLRASEYSFGVGLCGSPWHGGGERRRRYMRRLTKTRILVSAG